MIQRTSIFILTAIIAACGVTTVISPLVSARISPAGFNPGRIIDDALFYDASGMGVGNQGVANIQAFLDAHVPQCDTNGSQPSGYGGTRAQYAASQGWHGPPYVCLNNYHENPNTGETSFEKGGGAFNGGVSAARIIYNASQDHGINPKVLLVMLRKESLNLFSDSWPLKSQYKYAMGYACPDSGPGYSANCQADKAGFLRQVNYAAWQLRYYYNNMGSYNYAPGRVNTIQYSPNPSCGTKNVYIENYATASLYIYTPYTPNDAALNAYPGEANCGAYGNRNFWFFWQEWFGSTLANGNFLRTESNATVYLIGDNVKYPISDPSILGAASVLGGVGFTSQNYLDSIPTGPLMGRIIRSPGGTIYFYDANIKLAFPSCEMVSAYGSTCGAYAQLTQSEIDKFVTGPSVTKGMKTSSGKTFYIDGGMKREVLDDQSLTGAGLNVGFNTLNESAFNYLSYGSPIIRNGVVIKNRQDSNMSLFGDGSNIHGVKKSQETDKAFSTYPTGKLDQQSVQQITSSGQVIGDTVKDQTGRLYLFTDQGKREIADPASFGVSSIELSEGVINGLSGSGILSNPSLIKSPSDATVYVIVNGQKRPLTAMEDLKSITGEAQPFIGWVSADLVNSIPTGNIIIGAGRLVKTPSNATVYMTDGYDRLVPMSSFDPAIDLGVQSGIRTISESILSKYTVEPGVLSAYSVCEDSNHIGIAGRLYQLTISGKTAKPLQPQTCNVLRTKSPLPGYVRTSDGTIYQMESSSGTVRPISSWATYQSLVAADGGETVPITYATLSLLPQGQPI